MTNSDERLRQMIDTLSVAREALASEMAWGGKAFSLDGLRLGQKFMKAK